MMRIIIILCCYMLIPVIAHSQITVKDTTIKGKTYKLFPYTIYFEDIETEDIKDIEFIDDFPDDDELPSIPSLTDKLPDGEYISLDRYYSDNAETKVKSYINSYFYVSKGVKNGICIFKNEKGKIIGKGLYQNDVKNGKWDYYGSKNKIHYIISYESGIMQKDILLYNGKHILGKGSLVDGELEGDYTEYYNNGKLKRFSRIPKDEGVFTDGSSDDCDSIYAEYHDNGKPKIVVPCKNGYRDINQTEYDRKGNIVETVNLVEMGGGNSILKKTKYFNYGNEVDVYDYKNQKRTLLYTIKLTKGGDTIELNYHPKYYSQKNIEQDKDTSIIMERRKSSYGKYIEEKYIHLATKKRYSIIYDLNGKITYAPQITKTGNNEYRFAEPHYDESKEYNIVSYKTYRGFVDTFNYGNAFIKNDFSYAYSFNPEVASDTMEFFHNGEPMNEILFYATEYKDKKYSKFQIFMSKIKHRRFIYKRIYNQTLSFNFLNYSYAIKTLSMKGYRKLNGHDSYYSFDRDSITLILPYHYKKGKIQFTQYLHRLLLHNGKIEGRLISDKEIYYYEKGIKHGSYQNENSGARSTGYYENGLKNGVFIERSNKTIVKVYKNDTIDGTVIELQYETNQPSCIYTMNMGVANGLFTILSDKPHDTLYKAMLKNNLLHGKCEKYEYIGIAKEYTHNSGSYVSAMQEMLPSRKLIKKYIANFENGVPKGTQYLYGKNGNMLHSIIPNNEDTFNFYSISATHTEGIEPRLTNINGHHTFYFKNGKMSENGLLMNSKKDSVWNYYTEDGVLYKQCDYNAKISLHKDSNIIVYGTYTTFYPNGKVHEKGYITAIDKNYDCDQEHDIDEETVLYTQIYDKNRQPIFTNGTGMVTIYYNTGIIKGKGYQKDTLRNGFWVLCDKNGNPREAGEYVNGEKNGRWVSGDLKGLRFIDNMCFSTEVDSSYIQEKAETGLNISETIYRNGETIVDKDVTIYRSDRPRKIYGNHGDNF